MIAAGNAQQASTGTARPEEESNGCRHVHKRAILPAAYHENCLQTSKLLLTLT